MITPYVVPGVSTEELDKRCYDFIVNEQNAIPANVGYNGFEKTICSSVNQVICHGIPSDKKILKDGDILNIDVTVIHDGWHGDSSKMFLIGKTQPHNERLVRVTQECLYKAIEVVKPGARLGDIIEALAIFVMKSSGIKITNEQKKVNYKFNGDSIEGRQDVEIDGKIWDIKSASPYSFEKKFGEAGGFNEVVREDSFGYASQGFLYGESQDKDFGGWIAINKSTGEWTVCETPPAVDEYKKKTLGQLKVLFKSLKII